MILSVHMQETFGTIRVKQEVVTEESEALTESFADVRGATVSLDCEAFAHEEENTIFHSEARHTNDKLFKCDVCGKYFSRPNHLIRHQRLHTGEKPFNCNVCEKFFSQSAHLIQHQRVHTGEKPYKCDICGKCFTNASNLKRHEVNHTGERPFECEVCGKCFSQPHHLISHHRLHTVVMDVIKMEPEVDPLGLQPHNTYKIEENNALSKLFFFLSISNVSFKSESVIIFFLQAATLFQDVSTQRYPREFAL
ncbi:hypothetical protein ANN_27580 [Periplaneta americana]|uniref:C2H2-type domain-containing protein n=1 Tax=Periplaneta americana TaxID=6978 RepID=A0ABQ8RW63_PERAM|nr:hypothetical protein ANN_27580 [Periplaneta americana]